LTIFSDTIRMVLSSGDIVGIDGILVTSN
jgi:hypothetical protein